MAAKKWIPYGRQSITDEDERAVVEALRSDFLTTGPRVAAFEGTVAEYCGARHAAAVANGTAALHCCMFALDIKPGDEVIVTPMTFAASANCVLYQGGTPVFADVDRDSLLLTPEAVEAAVTERTRAVVAVDYAGQPCDWDGLRDVADRHGLKLVADACHAIGAEYRGTKAGTLADLTVFSFHPVKHVTTGEGGMVLTDDPALDARVRLFRNHGIATDFRKREETGAWFYEMDELGYNYRITDIQCALGSSQMGRLDAFLARRREIAARYDRLFAGTAVKPLGKLPDCEHAYHLYVVEVPERDRVFSAMRDEGIGVNVHYIPVHFHPYYRERLGTAEGLCPNAEAAYERILSLPMFPDLEDAEADFVAETLIRIVNGG